MSTLNTNTCTGTLDVELSDLFDLFVSQILNGGYEHNGTFRRFDVRDQNGSRLLDLEQMRSNFIAKAIQYEPELHALESEDGRREELLEEILNCIPAIFTLHNDDIRSAFSNKLVDCLRLLDRGWDPLAPFPK